MSKKVNISDSYVLGFARGRNTTSYHNGRIYFQMYKGFGENFKKGFAEGFKETRMKYLLTIDKECPL